VSTSRPAGSHQSLERSDRILRRAEYLAIGLAAVLSLATVASSMRSAIVQSSAHTLVERAVSVASGDADARHVSSASLRFQTGDVLGLLEIRRLGVSTAIFEGDGGATLDVGIGHLRDTPMPWEAGNVALSGHRDTFFRPLRDLRLGDDVQLLTAHGRIRYRVRRMLVVEPEDVWILNSAGVDLTLITCFPFTYVGAAPRRFIAQAQRIPDMDSPFGER
jgi:sortase A